MRKRVMVVIGTSVLVALVLVAFLVLPPLLAPKSVSLTFYTAGNAASFATGSSNCVIFTLQRAAVLTGGFVTNASVTLSISGIANLQGAIICPQPGGHYYTTGDVNHASLDVSLPAGSYQVILSFSNETTTQTWFNVTQSFVATY